MHTLFTGLGISLAYGVICALSLYLASGKSYYSQFLEAYIGSFGTLISLGLIVGTALIVYKSQKIIPEVIEKSFTVTQLERTNFYLYRNRHRSLKRSLAQCTSYTTVGFVIFTLCAFPLPEAPTVLMMIAACTEYALGVYVGRKLFYAGLMLHSLEDIEITRNLFKKRELDEVNTYVNVTSTLTLIFVYLHVNGYYNGPFRFEHAIGETARMFLVMPAIIATPVLLIFNFYPRAALAEVYSKSIDAEIKNLKRRIRRKSLQPYEQMLYILEFRKMSRDEVRYRLRLTLSDLPVAITILIMVVSLFLR
jgi:hypothetical protein